MAENLNREATSVASSGVALGHTNFRGWPGHWWVYCSRNWHEVTRKNIGAGCMCSNCGADVSERIKPEAWPA